MRVAVWFSHGIGLPQAGAYGGADMEHLVWASEILHRQGKASVSHLLIREDTTMTQEEPPQGRKAVGLPQSPDHEGVGILQLDEGDSLGVEPDDVVITLTWDAEKPHSPPSIDYLHATAPTPGQFYLAAAACDELARTPIRNAIFSTLQQEMERKRQIVDIPRSSTTPPWRAG